MEREREWGGREGGGISSSSSPHVLRAAERVQCLEILSRFIRDRRGEGDGNMGIAKAREAGSEDEHGGRQPRVSFRA